MEDIIILQWNANGIRGRLAELKNYITTTAHKPHIICIQETFLKPKHNFNFHGYNIERRDRITTKRGGVITMITNTLSYNTLTTLQDIEEISIQVNSSKGKLIIANIYNPPNTNINIPALNTILQRRNCITVGDFNSHSTLWGSDYTDRNGHNLETLLDTHNCATLNTGEGTYEKQNGDLSPLDLTFVSANLSSRATWTVLHTNLGSDHLPIHITLDTKPHTEKTGRIRWATNRADWSTFVSKLQGSHTSHTNTEDMYRSLVDDVTAAANDSIPKLQPKTTHKQVPYWNATCSDAIKQRNKARNRARKTNLPGDCIEYRRLKAIAQKTLREVSKKYWEEYCTTLTSSSKLGSVWKMAKRMTGASYSQTMPNLSSNGSTAETNSEKANLLATHYAQISSDRNHSTTFSQHKIKMETEWRNTSPNTAVNHTLNTPLTLQELEAAIKRNKKHTSPGIDQISYDMVHHLPHSTIRRLLVIYNNIWTEGSLPNAWKESLVIPIPKQTADRTKPESYRPIALTAVFCKLFERILVNRLEWYLESNNLLNPLQSGFRKGRSTIDHLSRLHDSVYKAIHNKEQTLAVFLDFSKAFDMVWKEGLLHKLRNLGVGGNMYNCIQNFLSERKIRVAVGDAISEPHPMENGTPQGSIISPLLFNIMINDLPAPTSTNTETSIFADDSSAWNSGKNLKKMNKEIQQHLDSVNTWSETWGFKLSENKTTAVLFTRKRKQSTKDITLHINGTPLKLEKEAKFLGVTYDDRLTFKPHITNTITKCKKVTNLMRSVAGQGWGASKKALLSIYNTLSRSRMDYGSEVYYTAKKTQLKKLDVMQNQGLRISCAASRATAINALENECGKPPLLIHRKRSILRFAIKLESQPSNPATSIIAPHWRATSAKIKYEAGKEPVSIILETYRKTYEQRNTFTNIIFQRSPPWLSNIIYTDTSLAGKTSKHTDPLEKTKSLIKELVHKYTNSIHIYTDGSKSEQNNKVAAAFYVKDTKFGHSRRLPNKATIHQAEMTAIKLAIDWVIESGITEEITIFCDCLSVVESIESKNSSGHKITLAHLLDSSSKLVQKCTVAWIPSHAGSAGNEEADKLAKKGTKNRNIEIPIPLELAQERNNIDNYINAIWQKHHNEKQVGAFHKQIEPSVSKNIKFTDPLRSKEALITRMRLGKCYLNKHLQELLRHPTGLCDTCKTPETIKHYLMDCKGNNLTKLLQAQCKKLRIEHTLANIITNTSTISTIYTETKKLQRKL